jgi:hypothetical protein
MISFQCVSRARAAAAIWPILQMSKAPSEICFCCGNARFIACQSCNGSRKSTIHHFKFNSIALRCIKCDKNDGLVQCPVCTSKALSEQWDAKDDETEPANKQDAIKSDDEDKRENIDINNNNDDNNSDNNGN